AGAGGVFEDDNAVALGAVGRPAKQLVAGVGRLAHPDPAPVVGVDGCWGVEEGLRGPQLEPPAAGPGGGVHGFFGRNLAEGGRTKTNEQGYGNVTRATGHGLFSLRSLRLCAKLLAVSRKDAKNAKGNPNGLAAGWANILPSPSCREP